MRITPSAAAVVLYYGGLTNDFLNLDVHIEDYGGQHNLASAIQFQGAATVSQNGLVLRDETPQQSGPYFSRATGVSTVKLGGVDIQIGHLGGTAPSWWDAPAAYTLGGHVYNRDGTWVSPGLYSGTLCLGFTCVVR